MLTRSTAGAPAGQGCVVDAGRTAALPQGACVTPPGRCVAQHAHMRQHLRRRACLPPPPPLQPAPVAYNDDDTTRRSREGGQVAEEPQLAPHGHAQRANVGDASRAWFMPANVLQDAAIITLSASTAQGDAPAMAAYHSQLSAVRALRMHLSANTIYCCGATHVQKAYTLYLYRFLKAYVSALPQPLPATRCEVVAAPRSGFSVPSQPLVPFVAAVLRAVPAPDVECVHVRWGWSDAPHQLALLRALAGCRSLTAFSHSYWQYTAAPAGGDHATDIAGARRISNERGLCRSHRHRVRCRRRNRRANDRSHESQVVQGSALAFQGR